MQILFEDHHLIAVNKPAPLLTQAPAGVPSLEAAVKSYIKEAYQKPAGVYLGIPHRLDRPVTGVVLFARNTKAASRVAEQFQSRKVSKVYWALVGGAPRDSEGLWHDFILKVDQQARVEIVAEGTARAREAATRFRVIERLGEQSLLELSPLTGRMHQLRVQSAQRGMPVLGDIVYGNGHVFGTTDESIQPGQRIALHARSLTFEHPFRKHPVTIDAPLPETWPSPLRQLLAHAHETT